MSTKPYLLSISTCLLVLSLSSCGGGGAEPEKTIPPVESPTPVPVPTPTPVPTPDSNAVVTNKDIVYTQANDVARFLTQATFGPKLDEINALTGESTSQWFSKQLTLSPSLLQPVVDEFVSAELEFFALEATTIGFWRNAVAAPDQLRQRMAFSLSELFVVSNGGGEVLTDVPSAVAYFQDLLIQHAFGNYRDLLEAVTYSPAMGYYLTYQGSEKGDPITGRMPDENYARELLQLFTIGVVELNIDGTPRLDGSGKPIETYDNKDITGLAKVFTGLNINETVVEQSVMAAYATPMQTFEESHSSKEKTFLNLTIPQDTPAQSSITQALDHIFAHPNVAPFVATHLIQRLVMSNPSPEYVARVANAFNQGEFTLPDGTKVGQSRRGDLGATLAAVLFDTQGRTLPDTTGGKVREPILRFSHWARAFNIESVTPRFQELLWDTKGSSTLSQHPYRASSVFNFFRPGYIAPGTLSAKQGLKAPELQIVNASSIAGYTNFMTYFIFNESQTVDNERAQVFLDETGVTLDANTAAVSFISQYNKELELVNDHDALLDHLDLLLTYGTLSQPTRDYIKETLAQLPQELKQNALYQVQLAVLLVMTSPDYLIQQ